MVLRLPEPMLARSGPIPSGRGWTFEPKLDGFRCLVCTDATFCARSRRGWDMSHLLPELRGSLPEGVQLDGELVALDETGRPVFHRLSSRMLHGRAASPRASQRASDDGLRGAALEAAPLDVRRAYGARNVAL